MLFNFSANAGVGDVVLKASRVLDVDHDIVADTWLMTLLNPYLCTLVSLSLAASPSYGTTRFCLKTSRDLSVNLKGKVVESDETGQQQLLKQTS